MSKAARAVTSASETPSLHIEYWFGKKSRRGSWQKRRQRRGPPVVGAVEGAGEDPARHPEDALLAQVQVRVPALRDRFVMIIIIIVVIMFIIIIVVVIIVINNS